MENCGTPCQPPVLGALSPLEAHLREEGQMYPQVRSRRHVDAEDTTKAGVTQCGIAGFFETMTIFGGQSHIEGESISACECLI